MIDEDRHDVGAVAKGTTVSVRDPFGGLLVQTFPELEWSGRVHLVRLSGGYTAVTVHESGPAVTRRLLSGFKEVARQLDIGNMALTSRLRDGLHAICTANTRKTNGSYTAKPHAAHTAVKRHIHDRYMGAARR